jgi:hypothetical protein
MKFSHREHRKIAARRTESDRDPIFFVSVSPLKKRLSAV